MSKKKRRTPPPERQANDHPQTADLTSAESAEERRARQIREWEQKKKAKEQAGKITLPLIGTISPGSLVGVLTSVAVVVGAIGGVFLLLSGGGGDSSPAVTATPDPRVAGLAVAKTVDLEAADSGVNVSPRFDPVIITGQSGDVIEIALTNTGSSAHNLSVAGIDEEFGTRDDFSMDSLDPGEEGSLLVKFDDPGTYPFRCDLHPDQQVGNLILS